MCSDPINETITFRAINPDNVEQENEIIIDVHDDKTFEICGTPIDAQQLAELGALFFALAARAGIDDVDSCGELLDGFSLPVPTKELQELING